MNIVILTNILNPYRKFFYDQLWEQCKKNGDSFHVLLMARTEEGRNWNYEDYATSYSKLLKGKKIQIGKNYTLLNFGLKKEIKRLKPDIVITAGSYMMVTVWLAIRYASKLNYKVYYWSESHDDEERNFSKFKMNLRTFFRTQTIKRFDGFWFAGRKAKEMLLKYSNPAADYIFVPNLVDNSKFASEITEKMIEETCAKYHIDKSKRVFICPARLHPVKGIMEFLQLFDSCENHDRATILIAGQGELHDAIQEYVDQRKLDVRLLGYIQEDEMVKLYAISDVFLMPSKSDPNPLTCIEACWRKLPLLVSEHVGNYPELVEEGTNGYVFSYKNPKDAIDKINKMILASTKWMKEASEYSYETALSKYEPHEQVCRIINEVHVAHSVSGTRNRE